jgi:hypothetical protein
MAKIEGRQISALAQSLYGVELSAARADALGEIIGMLSEAAAKAVSSLPMEAEPVQFETTLSACRAGVSR